MEAPEYSAGNYQFTPDKQGKDHFIIEDLLDFSNEEEDHDGVGGGDADADAVAQNSAEPDADADADAVARNSADSSSVVETCNSSLSGGDQLLSSELVADAGDLCEPYDELAELEWLSNFVEESFSSKDLQKLQLISGVQSSTSSSDATCVPVHSAETGSKITNPPPSANFLPESSSVPGKARSKRSRAAPCDWSSRLLVLPSNAADPTSSSSESSSIVINLPRKAPKTSKKKESGGVGPTLAPSDGRRCLHCATDKTPQWRTGPMGPKTLCNACGVRYKSGRLVPEYRPASSPTFVLSRHSNSHRKVLELRRQKEMHQEPHPLIHIGNSVYDAGSAVIGEEFLIHHRIGPDFRQLI